MSSVPTMPHANSHTNVDVFITPLLTLARQQEAHGYLPPGKAEALERSLEGLRVGMNERGGIGGLASSVSAPQLPILPTLAHPSYTQRSPITAQSPTASFSHSPTSSFYAPPGSHARRLSGPGGVCVMQGGAYWYGDGAGGVGGIYPHSNNSRSLTQNPNSHPRFLPHPPIALPYSNQTYPTQSLPPAPKRSTSPFFHPNEELWSYGLPADLVDLLGGEPGGWDSEGEEGYWSSSEEGERTPTKADFGKAILESNGRKLEAPRLSTIIEKEGTVEENVTSTYKHDPHPRETKSNRSILSPLQPFTALPPPPIHRSFPTSHSAPHLSAPPAQMVHRAPLPASFSLPDIAGLIDFANPPKRGGEVPKEIMRYSPGRGKWGSVVGSPKKVVEKGPRVGGIGMGRPGVGSTISGESMGYKEKKQVELPRSATMGYGGHIDYAEKRAIPSMPSMILSLHRRDSEDHRGPHAHEKMGGKEKKQEQYGSEVGSSSSETTGSEGEGLKMGLGGGGTWRKTGGQTTPGLITVNLPAKKNTLPPSHSLPSIPSTRRFVSDSVLPSSLSTPSLSLPEAFAQFLSQSRVVSDPLPISGRRSGRKNKKRTKKVSEEPVKEEVVYDLKSLKEKFETGQVPKEYVGLQEDMAVSLKRLAEEGMLEAPPKITTPENAQTTLDLINSPDLIDLAGTSP